MKQATPWQRVSRIKRRHYDVALWRHIFVQKRSLFHQKDHSIFRLEMDVFYIWRTQFQFLTLTGSLYFKCPYLTRVGTTDKVRATCLNKGCGSASVAASTCQAQVLFFGGHKSFLWDHRYPCFGLLMTSSLDFKAKVDAVVCVLHHLRCLKLILQEGLGPWLIALSWSSLINK